MLRTMFLCVMVIYTKVQTHDKNISDNFIVIITVVHWINHIYFVWEVSSRSCFLYYRGETFRPKYWQRPGILRHLKIRCCLSALFLFL